jgi:hypothetical protein
MTINNERIKALTQQSNAHELSPAQELFWKKIMDDLKNTTSKKILLKVEKMEQTLTQRGGGGGKVWAWAKAWLKYGSETASKIRIDE